MATMKAVFMSYEASTTQVSLSRLVEWLRFLRPENLAALKELIPALDDFVKASEVGDQVRAGLKIMTIIARMTANQTDDKLAEMLTSIATDEVIGILVGLIGGFTGGAGHAQSTDAVQADKAKAEAAGIPWGFLVQIALQLFDILSRFKKPV